MSRKPKRFQFITDFFSEHNPQTADDLDVVYKAVNMARYVRRIFQSATSPALQVALCRKFPLIQQLFGLKTHTHRNEPEQIVYVGLAECLLRHKQELEVQIAGLEDAQAYAELRLANPKQNMLHIYCTAQENEQKAKKEHFS